MSGRGARRAGGALVALGAIAVVGAASAVPSTLPDDAGVDAAALPPPPGETLSAAQRAARTAEVSRSQPLARAGLADRAELRDHRIAGTKAQAATGGSTARAAGLVQDPRSLARSMLADFGWDASEFSCLDELWVSESDWEVDAENPTSGAYGIPQSLPPEKMASAGSDWRTNPETQIAWGLEYIDLSYGTPCSAWEFKQANNWY